MSVPSQDFLRKCREEPDPALVEFVGTLESGRSYSTTRLWHDYNGRRGYCGSAVVFRYALRHAGMTDGLGGGMLQ